MSDRNSADPDDLAVDAASPAPAADQERSPSGQNGAKRVAIVIIALALLVLGWSVVTDRVAPSTDRSVLSAQVLQIAPRVSGRAVELFVQDNQRVEAGEPLFRVDPKPYELAVRNAQAQLRLATQDVSASTAQIEAAQAGVAQARVNVEQAASDAERFAQLAERGSIPRVQAEDAAKRLAAARAALDAANSQAEVARRQLGDVENNAQLDAAQQALEQAEYDAASTLVVAPASGAISNLQFAVGEFVGTGAPALTFISAEDLWISADMRENQLGNIKPGDPAVIAFDAIPGRVFKGTVGSIGWGIYAGHNQADGLPVNSPPDQWFEPARRIPVRVYLDGGPLSGSYPVRVGGNADVLILTEKSGAVGALAQAFQRLRSYLSYLH